MSAYMKLVVVAALWTACCSASEIPKELEELSAKFEAHVKGESKSLSMNDIEWALAASKRNPLVRDRLRQLGHQYGLLYDAVLRKKDWDLERIIERYEFLRSLYLEDQPLNTEFEPERVVVPYSRGPENNLRYWQLVDFLDDIRTRSPVVLYGSSLFRLVEEYELKNSHFEDAYFGFPGEWHKGRLAKLAAYFNHPVGRVAMPVVMRNQLKRSDEIMVEVYKALEEFKIGIKDKQFVRL